MMLKSLIISPLNNIMKFINNNKYLLINMLMLVLFVGFIKYGISLLDLNSTLLFSYTECEGSNKMDLKVVNADNDNTVADKSEPSKEMLGPVGLSILFVVSFFTFFGAGVCAIETYRFIERHMNKK
jgi:hypothetical protein